MKFSKYISKAATPVMALFKKQHSCPSNKATTICGYYAESLRQVPIRHNRGGNNAEIKMQFAPPTMCRLTPLPTNELAPPRNGSASNPTVRNLRRISSRLFPETFSAMRCITSLISRYAVMSMMSLLSNALRIPV